MSDKNITADGQGSDTQTDDKQTAEGQTAETQTASKTEDGSQAAKTFTQEDLNRLLARVKREWEMNIREAEKREIPQGSASRILAKTKRALKVTKVLPFYGLTPAVKVQPKLSG